MTKTLLNLSTFRVFIETPFQDTDINRMDTLVKIVIED